MQLPYGLKSYLATIEGYEINCNEYEYAVPVIELVSRCPDRNWFIGGMSGKEGG